MTFRPAPLVLNANTYCRKFILYYLRYENASIRCGDNTKHPHCREGVCVGRSYRNRTYTVGVRGPSATTTPSSIAESIIYHIKKFCKYFLQIVKTNSQSLTFYRNFANIISVNRIIKPSGCSAVCFLMLTRSYIKAQPTCAKQNNLIIGYRGVAQFGSAHGSGP